MKKEPKPGPGAWRAAGAVSFWPFALFPIAALVFAVLTVMFGGDLRLVASGGHTAFSLASLGLFAVVRQWLGEQSVLRSEPG
ncbi:hypothetical protein GCM10009642_28250 [Nocardiopsis metallicus]|uniref:Uncharacterized protein n=1 Tax=Nocardiopsis metallicus TaxID=179819 RepID=A0A840W2N0_9ACTN|nr:hypothetical protein [Nocardiopsis metallicus]